MLFSISFLIINMLRRECDCRRDYLELVLSLLRSGDPGGIIIAGFFRIWGLALRGGLLGWSAGTACWACCVCVVASTAADELVDDDDDVRVFFFSVHWFCLANRSAAVISGLSGPVCWGLRVGEVSASSWASGGEGEGEGEVLELRGRSITKSGVCFWRRGSTAGTTGGGGAGEDSESTRRLQSSRFCWKLLLLPVLPSLLRLLRLLRSASTWEPAPCNTNREIYSALIHPCQF